jgi:hypothetical protein
MNVIDTNTLAAFTASLLDRLAASSCSVVFAIDMDLAQVRIKLLDFHRGSPERWNGEAGHDARLPFLPFLFCLT